ncbi:sensor histidine kinase [Microbacterium thalli]|uniref:sensor histidine kinase n=1 Tax=Microbacterium thalli TaxID=3027921 RepID=UPI0023652B9D|nr:ATP-binding protein [Microbacterium thalli]MDD7929262.1 ATP-binding protein [Microbacterium thalli]
MTMRPSAVRLVMLVVPSLVTIGALSATAGVALALQERTIRTATTDRVLEVASSLAELPEVREAVAAARPAGTPDDLTDAAGLAPVTAVLQPIAELVGEAAGVYYVVITDDEGVRITHPLASERGVQVETANASVLAGETFVGTEVGASGPSLRAKVPVRDASGEPIGMVAVGVLESQIASELDEALSALRPWAIGALVIATLAGSVVTAVVERRFRRLDVIAAEHAQMRRTTAALREQSHEFRTRLHVIHGLVSRGQGPEALGYIEDIVPVRRAEGEFETSGDGRADDRPIAAATMRAVQAELLDLGAQARFDLDLASDLDEGLVSVVTNLCRNAAEAGATVVSCALRTEGERVIGSVEDDGPGVDPSVAGRIFTPGFSSKHDASGFGRGLGLDVVRRIVTARGGSIEVGASTLGGARFTFDLAVAR